MFQEHSPDYENVNTAWMSWKKKQGHAQGNVCLKNLEKHDDTSLH